MKNKLIASILFLITPIFSIGWQETLWRTNVASNTSAAATAVLIPGLDYGDTLVAVSINRCGSPGSSLTVYDSSGAAVSPLFSIDTSSRDYSGLALACPSQGVWPFNISVSSGITYSLAGTVLPDVTILAHDATHPGRNRRDR